MCLSVLLYNLLTEDFLLFLFYLFFFGSHPINFIIFFFLLLETGDRGSLLLRSTEASDFQEDVQVYLRKLENEGMYASTKRRLEKQTKK